MKPWVLAILFSIYSASSWGFEKQYLTANTKLSQHFDKKGRLIKEEVIGKNGSRKVMTYDLKNKVTVILEDSNGDRFYERRTKLTQNKTTYFKLVDTYDSKSHKLIKSDKSSGSLKESQTDDCAPNGTELGSKSLDSLSDVVGKPAEDVKYEKSESGFLIDKACTKLYGPDFPTRIKKTMDNRLSCLKQLGSSVSDENVLRSQALLANNQNPPKLDCSEKDYDWDGVAGHSTFPNDDNYPYLSINPNERLGDQEADDTIFHEFFHLLGYGHRSGEVEMTYTCEVCCSEQKNSAQQKACDICKGNFTDAENTQYLSTLVDVDNGGTSVRSMKPITELLVDKGGNEYIDLMAKRVGSSYNAGRSDAFVNSLSQKYGSQVIAPRTNATPISPEGKRISDNLAAVTAKLRDRDTHGRLRLMEEASAIMKLKGKTPEEDAQLGYLEGVYTQLLQSMYFTKEKLSLEELQKLGDLYEKSK